MELALNPLMTGPQGRIAGGGFVTHLASEGIVVTGAPVDGSEEILTPPALRFVADLHRCFEDRRRELLTRRAQVQASFEAGGRPSFADQTRPIRAGSWMTPPPPPGLNARRVECVGSVDRESLMAGLYSRADVYVADLDGATSPTWESLLLGQRHLRDAVRGMIAYQAPDGREVELAPVAAALMLQPRGLHLVESRVSVDDEPVSAGLLDLGLFLCHNAEHLHQHRCGPFVSLGGVEGQLEAQWWHEVLLSAESILGLPEASIRTSLVVDTITGAFEVEEMLYELRERAAGLVCDRWNYVFSFVRAFGGRGGFLMPDTSLITMERHFLEAASMLVVQIGHRRGVPVIGVTSTQVPIPSDPIADRVAMARLVADKTREADGGFDGSRVGHPDFVRVAMGVFESRWSGRRTPRGGMSYMRPRAKDLLTFPDGPVTEAGVCHCVRVALRYLEGWLRGVGCLPVRHDQTTLAMVEVARAQLWHWIRRQAQLDDGRTVTEKLYGATVDYEMGSIRRALGEEVWAMGEFDRARSLLDRLVLAPTLSATVAQEGMGPLLERETSMR